MFIVELVLRWLHIFSAIALGGGLLFLRYTLEPALGLVADETRRELQEAVRRRWALVVMISSGLLLLSGLVNMILIPVRHEVPPYYSALLGIKFLLALPVFYFASVLAGRSKTAERFRGRSVFWLNLTLLIVALIVILAGVLRFTDREPKAATAAAEPRTASVSSEDRR